MKIRSLLTLAILISALMSPALAQAEEIKLEAQLVWGTNDSKSPDPSHKPVSEEVRKRLKNLPLKWTHYFEVSRKAMQVADNSAQRVTLDKCDVEVKNLGKSAVEISLFGKGEPVWKRTQPLPKGETVVLGGNAPNSTSWLVVLKRIE